VAKRSELFNSCTNISGQAWARACKPGLQQTLPSSSQAPEPGKQGRLQLVVCSWWRMDELLRPEASPEPDLRHVWQLLERTTATVSVLESTMNEVQRKLDAWTRVTQDGLADLWVKCGTTSTECRSFRLCSAAPRDDKVDPRCNSRGPSYTVNGVMGSPDIREDMQHQRGSTANTDVDFLSMQQLSQNLQRRLEAAEFRISELALNKSHETLQETLTQELARVRDAEALESAKAEAVRARVAQRQSAELILLRSRMCMDYALGDSSNEHTTATGSSLQSLPMEELPRQLERQPPLPRQVNSQLRKVSSADDSFGVSRAYRGIASLREEQTS